MFAETSRAGAARLQPAQRTLVDLHGAVDDRAPAEGREDAGGALRLLGGVGNGQFRAHRVREPVHGAQREIAVRSEIEREMGVDVADQAGHPVAERFEQHHRHAFMARGQDEQGRVPVELEQRVAILEAGHDHAGRRGRRSLDLALIASGMIGCAGDDEPEAGIVQAREGLDQVEMPLLLDDPADGQDVTLRRDLDAVKIGCVGVRQRRLDAVRNEGRAHAEPAADPVGDRLRHADIRMGEQHPHRLARPQDGPGHRAPFLALVVEAVMRHHDMQAEQARERVSSAGPIAWICTRSGFCRAATKRLKVVCSKVSKLRDRGDQTGVTVTPFQR